MLAALVVTVLLVWIGYTFARVFWLLVPAATVDVRPARLPASQMYESTQSSVKVDIQALQRTFVLSTGLPGNNPAPVGSSAADTTRLNLRLRGAVVSSKSELSSAIISSGDSQHHYRPGDSLDSAGPGVTLIEVHATHVLINNNGRTESLWMYPQETNQDSTTLTYVGDRVLSREAVVAQSDFQASNMGVDGVGQLSDYLRVQLYQVDGELRGIQLRYGSRQDLLSRVGLQVGDVITAVDDVNITEAPQLPSLLQRLDEQDSVRLTVMRGGSELLVNINKANGSL